MSPLWILQQGAYTVYVSQTFLVSYKDEAAMMDLNDVDFDDEDLGIKKEEPEKKVQVEEEVVSM